jgi:hypothetical protein
MKVGNTRLVRPVCRASSEPRFPFRRFFSTLVLINGIWNSFYQKTWSPVGSSLRLRIWVHYYLRTTRYESELALELY